MTNMKYLTSDVVLRFATMSETLISVVILAFKVSLIMSGRCFVMGGGGGAPVAHGCHAKDASHMKRVNCTISLAYAAAHVRKQNITQSQLILPK